VLRNPDEPTKLIGYNRFVIDQYASARAENDNNSGGNADVMKIIGTRWKALSDAEKKVSIGNRASTTLQLTFIQAY